MLHPISCLKSKRLHIRLRPAAEGKIRSGHPWIFAESIRDQSREGETGELAVIFDRKDQFLGVGLYDPASPLRVRVIHRGKPANIDSDWWRLRLADSVRRREGLFDSETTGVRWINGESDSFPALVLDQYAETLVLKLYSSIWFARLQEIVSLILAEFRSSRLVLRLSRNIQAGARKLGFEEGAILAGTGLDGPVIFQESGMKFEADVLKGQKTGFFLDQRENRRLVGTLSAGRNVLNAFSFSGGFSVYAARGGARSVTDIDISPHALESSRRNFALNQPDVSRSDHQLVQSDAFEWLREQHGKQFDVVILDPPSLAKRQSERSGALAAYGHLAEAGLRLTSAGGVLVCCSCSAHVRAEEFFAVIERAAARAKRRFQVSQRRREPPDHHAAFPEAEYLKAIYLRLD